MTCELVFKINTRTKTDRHIVADQRAREDNDRVLEKIVSEVGLETLQIVCHQIPESKIHEFVTGAASLSVYEQNINNRIKKTVIERIIALNECRVHPMQMQKWLSEKPIAELLPLLSENSLNREDLIEALSQYSEISKNNLQILEQFKREYGEKIVDAVWEMIPETRKMAIELGCIDLKDHQPTIKIECEKKLALGTLPPKEALSQFLEGGRVTKFESGYNGVFLIEGLYQEKPLTLVIKAPEKPSQEAFGASVMRKLQNKTPEMHVIKEKSDPQITATLHRLLSSHSEYKSKPAPSCFFVMSYLSGTTLEEIIPSDLSDAPFLEDLFAEIGQMAASDLFLFNTDRLPTIGMGNLANLMILKNEEGQSIGAAAIDTTTSLSSKTPMPMGDPLERVRFLARDILQGNSSLAAEIFDDSFPSEPSLDREASIQAIQEGLVRGLKAVAALTIDDLRSSVIPPPNSKDDAVDLKIYEEMLQIIQEILK